jgi:mono/diheme cytochrome c family protein
VLNKSSRFTGKGLLPILLILYAGIASFVPAQSPDQASKVKVEKVPARPTSEVSGSNLYHSYCATCHGQDGKGNGPAAPALKTTPTDLTLLAKNNGGKFPVDHVMNVLSNNSEYAVHGSKDMPIWGPIFRRLGADQSLGNLRARNVTKYLESIQAK